MLSDCCPIIAPIVLLCTELFTLLVWSVAVYDTLFSNTTDGGTSIFLPPIAQVLASCQHLLSTPSISRALKHKVPWTPRNVSVEFKCSCSVIPARLSSNLLSLPYQTQSPTLAVAPQISGGPQCLPTVAHTHTLGGTMAPTGLPPPSCHNPTTPPTLPPLHTATTPTLPPQHTAATHQATTQASPQIGRTSVSMASWSDRTRFEVTG